MPAGTKRHKQRRAVETARLMPMRDLQSAGGGEPPPASRCYCVAQMFFWLPSGPVCGVIAGPATPTPEMSAGFSFCT